MLLFGASVALAQSYPWHHGQTSRTIASTFEPPDGHERIDAQPGSFGQWLRNLPLKNDGEPVRLYNDERRYNQNAHVAIVDIDTGDKDLQQCADAWIRLRAEYLYSTHQYDRIAFNFTSGDRIPFRKWINGNRPVVKGNNITWSHSAPVDSSYKSFRNYLNTIFTYAGSYSLKKELKPKTDPCKIEIGDLFAIGGFPGHVVFVVDVAIDNETGERLFMLAQGFTPAQDIHILKNPRRKLLSPWYECDFGNILKTPQWTFERMDLMTLP